MGEMSVTEQRYKAVLAIIGDGRTVSEVASDLGVCLQTIIAGRQAISATAWRASATGRLDRRTERIKRLLRRGRSVKSSWTRARGIATSLDRRNCPRPAGLQVSLGNIRSRA